ncbi:hypothetical protein RM190_00530 [Paracoccus sp. CPCC 101403]|uniref:Uncharacterized protein n=1 Tax=Paracoccus broussonetiae TaxID=3075834 RepID=A0ABU3E7Z2_9RHOB|nr:hypothetical protein [Paracoccus sp. CPCC 101403]MDT1060318.1 hypothetical protein [Paracoccus sp. CPCC 101403]
MIHPPAFTVATADPFADEVQRVTGHSAKFVGHLPVCHALQFFESDRGIAGLVARTATGELGFYRITYSDRLYIRFGLSPADLCACALAALGVLEIRDMPRSFRRTVAVKRIGAALVAARAPTP